MSVTVIFLEMRSPGEVKPKVTDDPRFQVRQATTPQWQFNRFLYSFVGEAWRWREKLVWTDDQWRAYVESDQLQTFVAWYDGSIAGYYELRSEEESGVEIAYFGLAPQFIGRGLGGPLLTSALQEAWRRTNERVWVHTCTFDHPAALANYQARGLRIYKREVR